MHIYIYGSSSFKETVQKSLDHANVKFRMDENGTIEEIDSLEALKMAIEEEPENIYLIDHDKIIDNKSLNSKIKFLTPKDGIEKKFLDDHGIEDVSIDSIEDLPKYVIKKLESMHLTDIFDEDDESNSQKTETHDMHATVSEEEIDQINGILDDIESKNDYTDDDLDSEDNFDLDDDLKGLLAHDEDEPEESIEPDIMNEIPEVTAEVEQEEPVIDDMESLMDIDLEPVEQTEEKNEILEETQMDNSQGEQNMDDLTQLDQLQEDDLKAALDGADFTQVDVPSVSQPQEVAQSSKAESNSNESIQIDSSNVADLQALITQLLNNKTLEITIKVKE